LKDKFISVKETFQLNGRVAIITGGAGLLGAKHAEAIVELGGIAVLWDIVANGSQATAQKVAQALNGKCFGLGVDITNHQAVGEALKEVVDRFGRVDILINNAANNPKFEANTTSDWTRLENFPLDIWNQDLEVGLTGAFLCSQIVGSELAKRGKGVILNIASDLALIAPDQRIYRKPDLPEDQQPVKPVTYSVVKAGLLGLTRYLASYWAEKGVRVNSICPGGVYTNQDNDFVKKLTNLIPLGRMAHQDEYKAAVAFLISDASSYMTGANLTLDGGRTCW
jgi:NAD(P)-dependent dehydrogenase (short-subunit alcohol dehydrogenase family)